MTVGMTDSVLIAHSSLSGNMATKKPQNPVLSTDSVQLGLEADGRHGQKAEGESPFGT